MARPQGMTRGAGPGGTVVGVVPARLGSTRFPRKVLADLGGRPLVWRAAERLAASRRVGSVIVATDSEEVREAVESLGGRVAMVAEECATGTDRVAAAVRGVDAGIVVNLQADQVLVAAADIDRVIERLESDADLEMTTLAYPSDDRAAFERRDVVKVVVDRGGRALDFSRSPVASKGGGNALFLHHVGIYCFRREALERFAALPRSELEVSESLEQLRALAHGMRVGVVVTARVTPSVDRPEDLEEAARLMAADSEETRDRRDAERPGPEAPRVA